MATNDQGLGDVMKNQLSSCPKCDSPLRIARYDCTKCGTRIDGEFTGCSFCRLGDEDRLFALVFIQTEGNMKDVERLMGISYPTVKARLANLNSALSGESTGAPLLHGPSSRQPVAPDAEERMRVLDRLSKGEITAAEASRLLRGDRIDKEQTE